MATAHAPLADRDLSPGADQPPTESPYLPVYEMRFGPVMYGGVSLATHINGVAESCCTWYARRRRPSRLTRSQFTPGSATRSSAEPSVLLFGEVNPSRKLRVTFPRSEDEQPIRTPAQWPGPPFPLPTKEVTIELDPRSLSYWDESQDQWLMPEGHVTVYVGSSSRDIRLQGTIAIG